MRELRTEEFELLKPAMAKIHLKNFVEFNIATLAIPYFSSKYYAFDYHSVNWLCELYVTDEADINLLKIKYPEIFVY